MRAIIVLHRYLAVGVGLVMSLWCLSGFVMMYQEMPGLDARERVAGLQPLDLADCCELSGLPADDERAGGLRVEMLLGNPVLRGALPGGRAMDLRTGQPVAQLDAAQVAAVAQQFASGNGIGGTPRVLGTVQQDQWTLGNARRNQPAWHVAMDDGAGTELYINGASGEVFMDTNRRERIVAWFGAIPHWLYPTLLRQNGALWTQVVIWGSVVGMFLVGSGLYLGIMRMRPRRKGGKWSSPFRRWWYWHHMLGLTFGVLTLTWVFSGLMTMNPWGLLQGGRTGTSARALATPPNWGEVRGFLEAAAGGDALRGDVRQLQPAAFAGHLYMLALAADGTRQRLDASARPALLQRDTIEAAVARLPVPVRSFELMQREDSYYYGHKREAALPVYRAILADEDATRLYINPDTGAVRTVNATRRTSRWLHQGLHSLDLPFLRARPLWDVVVMLLLAGVTAVCITGTWMALKRVRSDWRRLRRFAVSGRRGYSAGTAPAR